MKKTLILILITLLLLLSLFVAIRGLNIGGLEILGIKQIQSKSNELDKKIQQAGKLAEKDYVQAVKEVENSSKELKTEKKNYDDLITINTETGEQLTNQIEKYEIETLWVRLGNHATSNGAVMQMDVLKGTNGAQGTYNLKFTVTGDYISIADFISSIENDSTLGFKIEEFSMKPNNKTLQATFVCKDIAIKDVDVNAVVQNNEENKQDTSDANNTNTNTTNNTTNSNNENNNNTTNTTNEANTANQS